MSVYIRSNESNLFFFPENKPWHFKVHLKTPLIFPNICSESIVDGEKKSRLRRISMSKTRQWDIVFNSLIYLRTIWVRSLYKRFKKKRRFILRRSRTDNASDWTSIMNSKLYVPDPIQWIRYFLRKPADN